MKLIKYNLISLICVICGCAGMILGVEGWGWFLVVAVALFGTVKTTTTTTTSSDKERGDE